MSISYFDGNDATKLGSRVVHPEQPESKLRRVDGENIYLSKASSTDFRQKIEAEVKSGRTKWAQLVIEIDDISLAFWLPAELDAYCEVFATTPFPTAKTLLKRSPDSTELNSHWLSRLPKKAKSGKFRVRFLRYVETRPTALIKFQDFYSVST
ncbi:MAG: hypothetical protein ABJZ83_05380 [Yoonia sp.]|uniref:hypothetical protein n=1 Tax=Yoonia sp. TaxID=2212373 RepID=UPI003263F0A6